MTELEKAARMALEFCEFCWRDVAMNDYALEKLEQTTATLTQALATTEPLQHDGSRGPFDGEPMSAHKAAYFIRRFKREEKLLGPNEQLAIDFVLSMLTATTERKGPLSKDLIREVFLSHGFTIKEGQTDLKPYVYDAAYALIALVQQATERKGEPSIPAGWVACRIEHEPGYPEDVAYGPQRMMDRLKKWLDKHFANTSPQVPEDADPLQGAVNWLCEARLDVSVDLIQQKLHIGYNRAKRLFDAARKGEKS